MFMFMAKEIENSKDRINSSLGDKNMQNPFQCNNMPQMIDSGATPLFKQESESNGKSSKLQKQPNLSVILHFVVIKLGIFCYSV